MSTESHKNAWVKFKDRDVITSCLKTRCQEKNVAGSGHNEVARMGLWPSRWSQDLREVGLWNKSNLLRTYEDHHFCHPICNFLGFLQSLVPFLLQKSWSKADDQFCLMRGKILESRARN